MSYGMNHRCVSINLPLWPNLPVSPRRQLLLLLLLFAVSTICRPTPWPWQPQTGARVVRPINASLMGDGALIGGRTCPPAGRPGGRAGMLVVPLPVVTAAVPRYSLGLRSARMLFIGSLTSRLCSFEPSALQDSAAVRGLRRRR